MAARTIASLLKTSLGPKGMDKMLVSPDGEVIVTNDGATILEKMEIHHQTARLLAELSASQDNEIGDGTTGVVVLAGAILEQAQKLLDKGIHPLKVADGFERACEIAVKRIGEIAEPIDIKKNNFEFLRKCATTALGSKVVSKCQDHFADLAVKSVIHVADIDRKDVNFDLIKIIAKAGGAIEDSQFIEGIVIDKDFSHPQMQKEIKDAKVVILTCPFEPPKPKTKHGIEIKNAEDYVKLQQMEQQYFTDMVKRVKDSGANVVLCQWGFDDEANHLLYQNGLPAVRWVGGVEIELLAIATGARIVPRFEEITADKLGKAGLIKEMSFGTSNDRVILIQECENSKAITVMIRGGSRTICDEARRCLHDAICVVRNMVRDNMVVAGGGATELACSIAVSEEADKIKGVEQYAVRAFADALEEIPLTLAENSGYSPIEYVSQVREEQIREGSAFYGVDANAQGTRNMYEQGIFESAASKKHQLELATQVVKMILKIDDVIAPKEYE
jgi:T-complex protein 1 subunit epsilon